MQFCSNLHVSPSSYSRLQTVTFYRGIMDSEEEYHNHLAVLMTPGIAILSILMILGILGNTLVLYIYSLRLKRSPTHLFIIALACSDTVVCSLCIPIEIFVMRYLYSFSNAWLCKVLRTIVLFCVLTSVSVLVSIAVDRYKRICTPFKKQLTLRTTKLAIGCGAGVAAVLSSPRMVLSGRETVNMTFIGYACSTDDNMVKTPFPGIHNGLQLLLAVVGIVTLTTLYALILKRVRIQVNYRRQSTSPLTNIRLPHDQPSTHQRSNSRITEKSENRTLDNTQNSETQGGCDNQLARSDKALHVEGDVTLTSDASGSQSEEFSARKGQKGKSRGKMDPSSVTHKTTFMMFLITAVFIISFIPHLGLLVARAALKHTFDHLDGTQLALYHIFLRSYFICSVSNPIIYSFLSDSFRSELHLVVTKCFHRKSYK